VSERFRLTAPLLLLLILTFGFRFLQLGADPPANFSWSGGYFADEGFWSHNARNSVLFGNPVQDEWDARIVSPIFARFQQLIFHIFGPGFIQVRIIGILSSLLLACASYFIFRRNYDPQKSFLISVLILFNYPMMVLGRQGILDPFAAMLAWLAFLFALRESSLGPFLSGVFFVAACVTKYLMIYAAVPLLLLFWPQKRMLPFLFGVIAAIVPWLLLNYIPNRTLLGAYSSYYASQQSWNPAAVVKNILLQPFYLYFVKSPAILTLGNLGLWYFLLRFRKLNVLQRVCFLWLLSGILFFAIWRYRPERYYTSLIPVLAAMSAFVLLEWEEITAFLREGRVRWLVVAGLLLPVMQIAFVLLDRFAGWNYVPPQLGIHSFDAILFIGFSAVVLIAKPRKIGWIFLAVFLLSDLRNYSAWMLHPQYSALKISHDLQNRAPKGVIAGQWAPELCLGNDLRVVPVWRGFVNSGDPFQKYGITDVLQWKYPLGGEKFEEWFPQEFQKFQLVTKYRIKDSDLYLYERKENP
jgi:4-amino-4-deoxy-L-arabinose transferase-like glycosyltransferase